MKTIHMPAPELEGPDKQHYVVIDEKITHTELLTTHSAPSGLFDKSLADVSFVAGLLIDKFLYHLPLYRQHQRLQHNGIPLARSTLTNRPG